MEELKLQLPQSSEPTIWLADFQRSWEKFQWDLNRYLQVNAPAGGGGGGEDLAATLVLGNSAGNVQIRDLADGTLPQDAITLAQLLLVGGEDLDQTLTIGNSANNQQIKNLADGTLAQDAVTLAQLSSAAPSKLGVFGVSIDGGSFVPEVGSKGYVQVPYAMTLAGWGLFGNISGSVEIGIAKSTYAGFPTTVSITGGNNPALVSQQKNTDVVLAGWTTSIAAGDVIEFSVVGASTLSRVNLVLWGDKV